MVTVQPCVFLDIPMFFFGIHRGASFVCLPTPVYTFYLLTYRPRPMQANYKSAPVFVRAGDAVSKHPKMKMMLTVKAYLEVMMLQQIGRK